MSDHQSWRLEPGTLWDKIVETTKTALGAGALQPIATESEMVEAEGVNFLVRVLANVGRKDKAKEQQRQKTATSGQEFNPFLPYEEALFVADISETHLCLLNKFNVVDYHILIVTREFEDQEQLLTVADFEALLICLEELDGLGFYNGGKEAGASQRHKHLQLVPAPLTTNGPKIPIDPLITTAKFEENLGKIPNFPFRHGVISLKFGQENATDLWEKYHQLLEAVKLTPLTEQQAGPYNLLITREWMFLVARSQESFQGISVNSLGFAGGLLVRNIEQMELLQKHGPINVLKHVALEW